MQIIQTEKWSNDPNRDFEIYTYRDNNNDRLVIKTAETTKGRRYKLEDIHREIPMKGEWNLKPHEYAGYEKALTEVKSSILIHCQLTNV